MTAPHGARESAQHRHNPGSHRCSCRQGWQHFRVLTPAQPASGEALKCQAGIFQEFLQVKSELINCSAASAAKGDGSTWAETPAAPRNGPDAPVTFPQSCQRDTGNRKPAGFIGQLNQASAEPFQLLSAEPQHSAGLFATTAPTWSPGQGELPPSHGGSSARLSVLLLRAEHL